jgi:hypothetical protein
MATKVPIESEVNLHSSEKAVDLKYCAVTENFKDRQTIQIYSVVNYCNLRNFSLKLNTRWASIIRKSRICKVPILGTCRVPGATKALSNGPIYKNIVPCEKLFNIKLN